MPFGLVVSGINQGLEVTFPVGPTPWQPIHRQTILVRSQFTTPPQFTTPQYTTLWNASVSNSAHVSSLHYLQPNRCH